MNTKHFKTRYPGDITVKSYQIFVQHAFINPCILPLAGRSLGFGAGGDRDVEPLLKPPTAQRSDKTPASPRTGHNI